MLSFLLFLSLAGNAGLLYYALTQRSLRLSEEQYAQIEKIILRQAMQARGRLMAVEVAARSAYSLGVVEFVLGKMVAENQCLSDLDADGRAVYVFPQFDDTRHRQEATEREILLLAKVHGGELTPEQIAMRTIMTIDEARQWLMFMSERGICAPSTEQGELSSRFRFQGVRS